MQSSHAIERTPAFRKAEDLFRVGNTRRRILEGADCLKHIVILELAVTPRLTASDRR